MSLQLIHDSNGEPNGVYIPIKDWEEMKKKHEGLKELEYSEYQFLKELKESVEEVRLAKQGKLKLQSAKELLDEL